MSDYETQVTILTCPHLVKGMGEADRWHMVLGFDSCMVPAAEIAAQADIRIELLEDTLRQCLERLSAIYYEDAYPTPKKEAAHTAFFAAASAALESQQ